MATATNPITGDKIQSKITTGLAHQSYSDNWELIFGKNHISQPDVCPEPNDECECSGMCIGTCKLITE